MSNDPTDEGRERGFSVFPRDDLVVVPGKQADSNLVGDGSVPHGVSSVVGFPVFFIRDHR